MSCFVLFSFEAGKVENTQREMLGEGKRQMKKISRRMHCLLVSHVKNHQFQKQLNDFIS